MIIKPLIFGVLLLLPAAAALADDDCHDAIADWQPRETLRQQLEAEGWTIYRIKVDDGCYEVKGVDPKGIAVKASYSPASLTLMKWERDREGGRRNGEARDNTRHSDHQGSSPSSSH